MYRRIGIIVLWTGLLLFGAFLRFHGLGERPIHADEATGARILATRLEQETYTFDPSHFHGPFLSMLAQPVALLRGEETWSTLRKPTLRAVTALAGTLLVLTPLLWIRWIGHPGALLAGGFLATSPLLVYYSRMYIHESLLALTAMLALPVLVHALARPGNAKAVTGGVLVGLMWATKETFVISLLAWILASAVIVGLVRKGDFMRLASRQNTRRAGIFCAAVLLTAALLYSDGFRHPEGMADAVRTYFTYQTVPGHEKPFLFYLYLLLWPKWEGGLLWSEGLLLVVILAGLAGLALYPERVSAAHRRGVVFLAAALLLHLALYSSLAYKTPWLMVVPWAHACLLAGAVWPLMRPAKKPLRILFILACLPVMAAQAMQSLSATGRLENDTRNPYAYVPGSRDLESLDPWLRALRDTLEPEPLEPLAVLGDGYWPLPWYLRAFDQIGYWEEPVARLQALAVVFVMPDQFTQADKLLSRSHTPLPRGLREDVPMVLYLRNDIWKAWKESDP